MIICLGPICIPLWGLLPFLAIFFRKIWTWILRLLGKDVPAEGQATPAAGEQHTANPQQKPKANLKIDEGGEEKVEENSAVEDKTLPTGVQVITSDAQFDRLMALSISTKAPLIAKFTATWCGPCKMIQPLYKSLSEENAGNMIFVEIDVDDMDDLTAKYEVSAMPTFLALRNGAVVGNLVGTNALSLQSLVQKVDPKRTKALDAKYGKSE